MRTRKTVVLLISGLARAGKTTMAEMLNKKLDMYLSITKTLYSFSSPIKYLARKFFGWDGNKDDKGRKLLQDLGGVGREYDEDIWVKHMFQVLEKAQMFPFNFVIVDDWRFPNEYGTLRKNPLLDVVTIRVFGRGGLDGDAANDVTEISLPETIIEDLTNSVEYTWSDGNKASEIYNFVVNNCGDLELLEHKLDLVLAEISKRYVVE